MKRMNMYYIVSILALAFMMMIFIKTLEATGWFDKHGEKTPAERLYNLTPGDYAFIEDESPPIDYPNVSVAVGEHQEYKSLMLYLDSLEAYSLKINNFEDEQVLVEIFRVDTAGVHHKMEGCELILAADSIDIFRGSTIGDFCGLKERSKEYLAVDLLLSGSKVSLEIQTGVLGHQDSLDSKKFLLERIDSW